MLLAAIDVASAKRLIDRGLRSDEAWPEGKAYLMNTSDSGRNVRAETYERVKAVLGSAYPIEQVDADALEGKSDIMFEFTGVAQVAKMTSNRFLDGAMADHLTSWGGGLIGYDQTTALDWLSAGATGSYGTSTEPCSFRAKFPDVGVAMAHYLSGETLIEAYWKSVLMPGQGVFVGDPLARPFGGVRVSQIGRRHRDLDARAAARQLPLRGGAQQHRAVPGDPRRPHRRLRRSPADAAGGRHALLPPAQRPAAGASGVGCSAGFRSGGGRGAELSAKRGARKGATRARCPSATMTRDTMLYDAIVPISSTSWRSSPSALRAAAKVASATSTERVISSASRIVARSAASNSAGVASARSTSASASTCAWLAPAARSSGAW